MAIIYLQFFMIDDNVGQILHYKHCPGLSSDCPGIVNRKKLTYDGSNTWKSAKFCMLGSSALKNHILM